MPNTLQTIINPTPPSLEGMSPFMRGAEYVGQKRAYEDQRSLQDLMQRMGVQQQMAVQPYQTEAEIQRQKALGLTAVPEAQYKAEGLRLGNLKTEETTRGDALNREITGKKEAIDAITRAMEAGAIFKTMGVTPATIAQFEQRLGTQEARAFQEILGVSGPEDLVKKLEILPKIREQFNIDWAKLAQQREASRLQAKASNKPGNWEQYKSTRTKELKAAGMSPQQAEFRANRETADLMVKAAGTAAPSPTQVGEAAGAKALNEAAALLERLAGLTKDTKQAEEYRKEAARLRGLAGGEARKAPGLEPAKPGAAKPTARQPANAIPIEQARTWLKQNDTPQNRKFFEDTYGVKP